MILNYEVLNAFFLIKEVHLVISVAFLIVAVWLIIRSIRGIIRKIPYSGLDKFLSYGFIINLYIQLIFGLVLFLNPDLAVDQNLSGPDGALKIASNRFWPIEHIVLMLFALFIANLGFVFSNQSRLSRDKHSKILTYYVFALCMIAISLIAI